MLQTESLAFLPENGSTQSLCIPAVNSLIILDANGENRQTDAVAVNEA